MDALIEDVALHFRTLTGQVGRASDAIGRLGQSEFAIIAPATPPSGALRLAERIRAAVESVPLVHPPNGGSAHVQHPPARAEPIRLRAGYYAVNDFAESSVDAVEMLVRAASALRQGAPDAIGAPPIQEFGTQQPVGQA
jgi:GGDEF domain-containing protein